MEQRRPNSVGWFAAHPVGKIAFYYMGLAAGLAILYAIAPDLQGVFSSERFSDLVAGAASGLGQEGTGRAGMSPAEIAGETVITMITAVVVMLPVTWVFILTRSRKGFSQSTAQALIFLPIIVAGIIMLVRNSVALAFGLGGVVGAVGFRNRLNDPKDAMYIFLAITVGLAAGVQVGAVALAISLFFNLVVLIVWRTDFGRMPAELEASVAGRRLERMKASGAGVGEFVSLVDKQLLTSMTPDQLQALVSRASERRREAKESLGLDPNTGEFPAARAPRFNAVLRITMQPDDAEEVRKAAEHVLGAQAKRFMFDKAGAGDGGRAMAQYKVKFRKSNPSTLVVESIRRSVLPTVVTIDVRDA
ncbi:MAG: DUF4956 domain-containing protein [Gemmatimonadales bacterium]|nr:DUF4956 domain-containing protein [Gemmatimonadales bacterium]